jgi:hypothetical protein
LKKIQKIINNKSKGRMKKLLLVIGKTFNSKALSKYLKIPIIPLWITYPARRVKIMLKRFPLLIVC